nr:alpha/beta hydrolase [uncultured Leptotrichia sp.]
MRGEIGYERSSNEKCISVLAVIGLPLLVGFTLRAGILTHEFKVEEFGNINTTDKDIVVFIHGIYGKLDDLSYIKGKMEEKGYAGISIQYPTTKEDIQGMVEKYINPEIDGELKKLEQVNERRLNEGKSKLKMNFVVHSLGSVVLRHKLKESKIDELGKVVFISPPSHGSSIADNVLSEALSPILGKAVRQIKVNEKSFVNQLGEPDYDCYVIIGNKTNNPLYSLMIKGKDDGMVPIETARLKNCRFKVIDGKTHTSILKSDEVVKEILEYFSDDRK